MGPKAQTVEEITWTVAEAIGEGTGFSLPLILAHYVRDMAGEIKDYDPSAPPNPLFLSNGFDQTASPYTSKYMSNRTKKNMGGTSLAVAGTLASGVTQVDAAGVIMHSNSTGSTLAHIKMLRTIAQKYKRSTTIQEWVKAVERAKLCKAGIRGTELAGAAIPIGAVGIATGVGASFAKLGVQLTYGALLNKVAMEVHWRANVEMRLVGAAQTASGPASAIMFEIFRRRGATRVFGQYNIPKIISESGGWWALRDKLLLI